MKIPILLTLSFAFFILAESVQAKVLPQANKNVGTTKSTVGSGINVSPKLRNDRRAIVLYFSNLQNASSVNYALTYKTSTQDEGALGSISLNLPTASQELLFGTCSKNVCRYHIGVNNAKLEVSYTTKSGKKYLRKYRIKV